MNSSCYIGMSNKVVNVEESSGKKPYPWLWQEMMGLDYCGKWRLRKETQIRYNLVWTEKT